ADEPVVGDDHRQAAGLIVAELLRHGEREREPAMLLLVRIEAPDLSLDRVHAPGLPAGDPGETARRVYATARGYPATMTTTRERRSGEETEAAERWPALTYWVKVTIVVVVTIAVLALVRSVLDILILIVISIVLAVGMEPLIQRLTGWGLGRGW